MAAAGSSCDAALLNKLHRALMPIACLMVGFCYLDRSNIAYMQLELELPPPAGLNFSDALYGNASGMFFVGYAAFQIPSNLILANVGAPRWLTFIVCLWGFTAALMALMQNGTQFVLLRLALGVFEAGTFPGIWYHLTLFYPQADLTLPLSALMSAIMVAQIVSAPAAAVLTSLDGTLGLVGWQWLAMVEGLLTVAVGISLLWWLPARPADIKSLHDKELVDISSRVSRLMTASDVQEGLKIAATTPALWRLALVFALRSSASYCLLFWTPLVIKDLLGPSGKPLHAILLTSVPYSFAAAATLGIGWLSQKYNERKLHTAVPFGLAGLVLMMYPALRGGGTVKGVWALGALSAGLSLSNASAPMTASLLGSLPRSAQAGGLALWNTLGNVGGYFGPAIFGWLKESTGGNSAGMVTMGGFLLVSAWIMYTFAEQEAFQRVQQVNDAEYDPMLHRGTDSSQGYQQDDPSEVVTPFTSSLGTPNGHSAYEAHGTAVHRIVASSVSSSTL